MEPPARLVAALWVVAGAVALALLILTLSLTVYGIAHRSTIYSGVTVAGVDLGGLTPAEATSRLESLGTQYGQSSLMLQAGDQRFPTTPDAVGFDLDAAGTVEGAWELGRHGSLWQRTQTWMIGLRGGITAVPKIQVDRGKLEQQLVAISGEVDRDPVDARVDLSSGSAVLEPEVDGRSLDVAGSSSRVLATMSRLAVGPVPLVTTTTTPGVTADSLRASVPQAQEAISSPFTLTAQDGTWSLDSEQLNQLVAVDPATATVTVDRDAAHGFVEGVARDVDTPAANAGITVSDDGTVSVVPGQDAVRVDIDATSDGMVSAIAGGLHAMPVVITRTSPDITDDDARRGLAELNGYLDSGVRLTWSGGSLTLNRSDLVQALSISDTGGDPFLFQFDPAIIAKIASPAFARVDHPAKDARFRVVNGSVQQVQRSAEGELVDRDATTSALLAGIYHHTSEVPMVVADDKPDVTDGMGTNIRVPDLLAQGITSYATSSPPRRKNVERAAALEDGWLVPPDGIFSYNELLGSVDQGNGFDTGFGIITDPQAGGVTTAPVIGGGICQVSTTMLQAGWFVGLPIVERHQHPYWLTSYGQAPLGRQGLDATVNIEDTWALDLKMKNTTGNWIAFVVTADGSSLTVSLMGTNPGWDVTVTEPVVTDRKPADQRMEYQDSPEMPAGQELQVESATDGFSVRIDRAVRDRNGKVVLQDSMSSVYAASRNLTLRGTGAAPAG